MADLELHLTGHVIFESVLGGIHSCLSVRNLHRPHTLMRSVIRYFMGFLFCVLCVHSKLSSKANENRA